MHAARVRKDVTQNLHIRLKHVTFPQWLADGIHAVHEPMSAFNTVLQRTQDEATQNLLGGAVSDAPQPPPQPPGPPQPSQSSVPPSLEVTAPVSIQNQEATSRLLGLDRQEETKRSRDDTRESQATCFRMVLNGEIESAEMGGHGPLMCVFSMQHGPDWTLVSGVPDGITQLASASVPASFVTWRGGLAEVVWSFPLGVVYKSTSPFGWPRIVVTVYGTDLCNRRVVKGYGSVHVPCQPGRHTRTIRLYCPLSSSPLTRLLGALFGNPAQLVDPRMLAGTDGREVIRVQSGGKVRVHFDVLLKDTDAFNYAF